MSDLLAALELKTAHLFIMGAVFLLGMAAGYAIGKPADAVK